MLDNYRIVIRERKLFEQLDLSLRLLREHAAPLAVTFLAGMGPFFLFDTWFFSLGIWDDLDPRYPYAPMLWLALLMAWEMPLATAPATLYLGQALFDVRPNAGKIVSDFFGSLGQLIFYEMFLRGFSLLVVAGFCLICQKILFEAFMHGPVFLSCGIAVRHARFVRGMFRAVRHSPLPDRNHSPGTQSVDRGSEESDVDRPACIGHAPRHGR